MRQKTLYIIMSHKFNERQRKDAEINHNITNFVELPENLKQKWRNIPPESDCLQSIIDIFSNWVLEQYQTGDIVMIQGDFGATYGVVKALSKCDIPCCYATTKRNAIEYVEGTKTVKESTFIHVKFRFYENNKL